MPFVIPHIDDNEEGWGPNSVPEKFKDVPYYATYNKGDKLGKAADWTQTPYTSKGVRYQQRNKESEGVNTIFNYYYQDDDSSFVLVDNTKTQTRRTFTARHRFQNRGFNQPNQPQQRHPANRKFNRWQNPNKGKWGNDAPQPRRRDPSVEVKEDWKLLEEIDFAKLSKLSRDKEPVPEDIKACGTLGYYDSSYDRVSTKTERPLTRVRRTFFNVSTTDDPIIRQLTDAGNVFATDAVLAHLMATTRSVYPWDIIVQKAGSKLFFDKRDSSTFDLITVNENAIDPPSEEKESTTSNTQALLSTEATYINQNFSQQVLKKDELFTFPNPNPFASEGEKVAQVAYKYRKWELGDGITLVARCEVDGVTKVKDKDAFLTIKALNEYDPKIGVDWRKVIDSQRGAVLATELKNNSNKLAKWTAQSLLAGTDNIKLGYVSRVSAKDSVNHVILATQDYQPKEFATQINLNILNMWAVLKYYIDICMKQESGKYVLMRDPDRNIIRFYAVSADAFETPAEKADKKEAKKNED